MARAMDFAQFDNLVKAIAEPLFAKRNEMDPNTWHALPFNPVGLYTLRYRMKSCLRLNGLFASIARSYTNFNDRLYASDLAFLSYGAHDDGNHRPVVHDFHPLHKEVRESTEGKQDIRRPFKFRFENLVHDAVC